MTERVLVEADRLINGDRNTDYGHPADDFGKTAGLWTAWLRARGVLREGAELEAGDVAWMMVDVKRSRALESPDKRDHYVDAAGYVGTAWMVRERRAQKAADVDAPRRVTPSAEQLERQRLRVVHGPGPSP